MNVVGAPVRALVVDDSAVVRHVLTSVLTQLGGMWVDAAPDAVRAAERLRRAPYDVLVLDIEMPGIDGLSFLAGLMAERPMPVVICSGHVGANSDLALRALALGAVDVIAKPRLGAASEARDVMGRLVETVRAAATARVGGGGGRAIPPTRPAAGSPAGRPGGLSLVAIGASTGGTDAIRRILSALPVDSPPILVVQHMPAGFTAAFARDLDRASAMHVREAAGEEPLRRGEVLVAPGDLHLLVAARGGSLFAQAVRLPHVSRHRPSADVLLESVSRLGPRTAGVLLTGMGEDGAQGLLAMRQAGAFTIAQDEASCVVFGMPAAAIQRGAATQVLPLDGISDALVRRDSHT